MQAYCNLRMNRTKNKILPEPCRGKELWESTLKDGFQKFPQRQENYLKYKKNSREAALDYLPGVLDVENVSRCNYRCKMCQVSGWKNSKRAGDMSLEEFKKLIESQIGLVEVKIQGMGEPLLSEDFYKMVKHARKRHLWVRSTTNASLLHITDNYRKLLDSDICEIQISVDGASKESYQKIRKGGHFAKVKKNCVLLNSYGEKINQKRTRMWVVVQKDNFHEWNKFPKLAAELGFERLTFSLNLNGWGQESWKEKNSQLAVKNGFEKTEISNVIEIGKACNVEVTFWGVNNKYHHRNPQNLCPLPFQRLYISSDYKIIPCAGVGNPDIINFGGARELTRIWNGPKMIDFRNKHITGRIPDFCRACYDPDDEIF